MLYYSCKEKEYILNCHNAQLHEHYETASFYRGCVQGMVTAMY